MLGGVGVSGTVENVKSGLCRPFVTSRIPM